MLAWSERNKQRTIQITNTPTQSRSKQQILLQLNQTNMKRIIKLSPPDDLIVTQTQVLQVHTSERAPEQHQLLTSTSF